jgi:ATP-dependent Clp protease ATP-binding subunit ClpB
MGGQRLTLQQIEAANTQLETAQRNGDFETASRLRFSTIPGLQAKLPKAQSELAEDGLRDPGMGLRDRVTSEDIAVV